MEEDRKELAGRILTEANKLEGLTYLTCQRTVLNLGRGNLIIVVLLALGGS